MIPLPDPFPGETTDDGYVVRKAINWDKYRAVIFESDDWGACEHVRNRDDAVAVQKRLERLGVQGYRLDGTLETPGDLERLYRVLESVRGCDGRSAVFTAFMPLGNPDYAAIAATGFQEYCDIGLDEGLPPGWERGDLRGKWREGVTRGVFAPEFHAGLHHVSPILWLELLRGKGVDSQAAGALFEHGAYAQPRHLPEYHRMNAKMQHEWVSRAVARFRNLFGFAPSAGVTSDALPMTEIIWSVNGLGIFCLKNCRVNSGEVVVYDTKLWNSQDPQCPMGAYNCRNDLIYLNRNLHLDNLTRSELGQIKSVVESCWRYNEPIVTNTHRINYVRLDKETNEHGYEVLQDLLHWLAAQSGVRFLTTAEVGQLYRDGYSLRRVGRERLLRQWSQPSMTLRLPGPVGRVYSLPEYQEQKFHHEGNEVVLELKEGDYLLDGF